MSLGKILVDADGEMVWVAFEAPNATQSGFLLSVDEAREFAARISKAADELAAREEATRN